MIARGAGIEESEATMARATAKDFEQELLDLYDYYAHGDIDRREFLERAGKFAVGGLTAATLLDLLRPDYALARQVAPDDSQIRATYITYPSPHGTGDIRGYLVKPSGAAAKLPGVLVIHENRGLNPYIEDVARRLAKAGYMALAPDGLTSLGGYPGNDERGSAMQKKLDPVKLQNDFFAGYEHLAGRADCNGKAGAVGFCYGGGVCNQLAVHYPGLKAAVPFYGRQPAAEDVKRIEAPLLLHYAGLDTRIDAGWPAYEAALKQYGKTYTAYFYPGVNHGFHNDTTPRYDEPAAKLAWERTLAFFKRYLA